jgi:hypothetical protein
MGWVVSSPPALGFDTATGGDDVFRDLVFARIIEPTSKQHSLRVLATLVNATADYRTVNAVPAGDRQTESAPGIIDRTSGQRRSRPSRLLLYDNTFYFEPIPVVTDSATRVSPRTEAGTADHHWAAHRSFEVPDVSIGVRGQQGRARDLAAGHQRLPGRSPAHRRDSGRRCAKNSAATQIALQASDLPYILGASIPFLLDVCQRMAREAPRENGATSVGADLAVASQQ